LAESYVLNGVPKERRGCWDCGEKVSIEDGKAVTCGCDAREWASVPESLESGHVGQPESIWLMMQEEGG